MTSLTDLDQIEIDAIQEKISWETPAVFKQEHDESAPYPVDALPSIIREAVCSYQKYGQQPLPLIACSALANVSLTCQTMANVARDSHLISPVSLYFLVCSGSGERKSAADHAFGEAVRQWQLGAREKLSPGVRAIEVLHRAWSVEKDGLLSQIRSQKKLRQDTEVSQALLLEHMVNEPSIPIMPVLFFEDATQEALAQHLSSGWPSASLWSDEGAIIMSSKSAALLRLTPLRTQRTVTTMLRLGFIVMVW